jgi:hypothetical protein
LTNAMTKSDRSIVCWDHDDGDDDTVAGSLVLVKTFSWHPWWWSVCFPCRCQLDQSTTSAEEFQKDCRPC